MDILAYNIDELERWFLMFFRVSSILLVAPFYGYSTIPVRFRAALAFLVTSLLFLVHTDMNLTLATGVLAYIGAILHEVVIGLAIGLVTTLFFHGFLFAGKVIGRTMGFGMMNVADPMSQASIPVIGQLLNLMVLVLFLMIGGHHFLLQAVDESFVAIPLGGGGFDARLVEGFTRMSADIFTIGIKIAAPVLVAILVAEFALGFLARSVPQMNVWILGFPLKIGVGMLTLAISVPFITFVFGKLYLGWQGNVIDFIRAVATG